MQGTLNESESTLQTAEHGGHVRVRATQAASWLVDVEWSWFTALAQLTTTA